MTTVTFWCCLGVVADKHPTPAQRIASAVECVERNLGYVPAVVHCHPVTAAETTLPSGIAEIVPDAHVTHRDEFRFVREEGSADGE